MRIEIIKKPSNRNVALTIALCIYVVFTSCSNLRSSDDFINEYCKCLKSATDDMERHKCEVHLLEKMAEQMKSANEQQGGQQKKAQTIINEISQKLVETRKKCGGEGQ